MKICKDCHAKEFKCLHACGEFTYCDKCGIKGLMYTCEDPTRVTYKRGPIVIGHVVLNDQVIYERSEPQEGLIGFEGRLRAYAEMEGFLDHPRAYIRVMSQ